MMQSRSRRSCRVAMSIPIKIIGIDYRGKDFSEEAHTVTVNLHGAKIRMAHQLIPDAEIRLLSHSTGRDSIFRVISKVQSPERKFTYWGIENLAPEKNIWGVDIPRLNANDQVTARVTLACPVCSTRESLPMDEILILSLQDKGGRNRTCKRCKNFGLWKVLPSLPV